jgi:hypothetical protein
MESWTKGTYDDSTKGVFILFSILPQSPITKLYWSEFKQRLKVANKRHRGVPRVYKKLGASHPSRTNTASLLQIGL